MSARSWCVLVVLVSAVSLSGCVGAALPPPSMARPIAARLELPADVRVRVGNAIVTMPFEDYVLGSAIAEVSPVNESATVAARIFEVQAVLARTYAFSHLGRHRAEGFDLCDGTHCQVYDAARLRTSRFADAARAAVAQTAGEVLSYSGRPAEALFHADCGGVTASANDVWGGRTVPYLIGFPDEVPAATHRSWEAVATAERLRVALNADSRSFVGRSLDDITVLERDGSGRAAALQISGDQTHLLRGDELRTILNRALGIRGILSTRFDVARTGQSYRFLGTGFGHGVGLCQVGAAARARRGLSAEAILAAYYPGAAIERAR